MQISRPDAPIRIDSKRVLDLLVKHTHTQLAVLDARFDFVWVNEAYARSCDRTVEFLAGKNHFELFPSNAQAIFEEVVQTKKAFQTFARPFEYPDDPSRGVTYWDWTLVPILDSRGEVEILIFSLVDVTSGERARRELEEAREHRQKAQKLESLGRLTGGVAHDFNNVLTALVNYASILSQDLPPDSPSRPDVEGIADAVARGQKLVSQLLSFSTGGHSSSVNVGGIMKRARRLLQHLLPPTARLELHIGEGDVQVYAHPTCVDQILMNLVLNAGDALDEERGGTVRVSTHAVHNERAMALAGGTIAPGVYVEMRVEDDGTGMDEETSDRMFEPFFSTKGERGTGLGLATVRDLADQCGGCLDFETAKGEGTRFSVFLPTQPAMLDEDGGAVLDSDTGPAVERRILFVDDDVSIVDVVSRQLTRRGYEVLAVSSAERALERLNEEGADIDLLISDLAMPSMNGRELSIHARKLRPELRILHISGNPDGVVGWQDERDEGTPLLVKPFTVEELDAKIRSILEAPRWFIRR